jgi:glycosyltransferase involved in cell wall biosynthesis
VQSSRPRIMFYDDAPNFGGHEFMTLQLVGHLAQAEKFDVVFVVATTNEELRKQLAKVIPPISVELTPYASGRAQWLRTYLSMLSMLQLLRRIRRVGPDLLIVVQGGAVLSSLGIIAGRLAGVRTISYLPMTHDEGQFSRNILWARLRQWCVRPFYGLPHCLITISARMAQYASRRRRGPVRVIENGIPLPSVNEEDRQQVRADLGLSDDDQLLLMVGRIEFWQKRHDLAVRALVLARSRGAPLHLLVVGSGPDEGSLKELVTAHGVAAFVHFRPWQAVVSPFYMACDRLLLPSRFEGVPLVMLEAMYVGRKVLASDVDGMADMLPPSWRFPSGDAEALSDLLCRPDGAEDATHIRTHQKLISSRHTMNAFKTRFGCILQDEIEKSLAK